MAKKTLKKPGFLQHSFWGLKTQSWEVALLVGIVVLGFMMRLLPGKDHFSWIYDQARDAYVTRSILEEKNIVLVGPQTDYPGLNHGPLSYYALAPFYFLSKGDPNLPGLMMIVVNLSALWPLYLLTQKLFKDKKITYFTLFLFALCYAQIEYARWIFNFSFAIPLMLWSFWFLLKEKWWWAGFFLGLTIQSEIFMLYLFLWYGLYFYFERKWKWKSVMALVFGSAVGVVLLLVAEIKFGFLGIKTFLGQFLFSHSGQPLEFDHSLLRYLDHLAVTAKFVLGGLSYAMAGWMLVALLGFVFLLLLKNSWIKSFSLPQAHSLWLVLGLFFSHSVLFTFHFPDKVFLDFVLLVPLLWLVSFVIVYFWEQSWRGLAILVSVLVVFFNLYNLRVNIDRQTLFDGYHFIQDGMLFSHKMAVVDTVYQLAEGEDFSISVLGTPYGVPTVWASVFEQYERRHPGLVKRPVWVGFYASGYPADDFFTRSDHPKQKHVLIQDQNLDFIGPTISKEFLAHQNEISTLIKEVKLQGFVVQLRQPKEQLPASVE